MKINHKIKRKWLASLRGGELKQRQNDNWWEDDGLTAVDTLMTVINKFMLEHDMMAGCAGVPIHQVLGLSSSDTWDLAEKLRKLNNKRSFSQIADWAEDHT
jgi:hypothetical protein